MSLSLTEPSAIAKDLQTAISAFGTPSADTIHGEPVYRLRPTYAMFANLQGSQGHRRGCVACDSCHGEEYLGSHTQLSASVLENSKELYGWQV